MRRMSMRLLPVAVTCAALAASAGAQTGAGPRPDARPKNPPAPTKPASEMKPAPVDPSATSAPLAEVQKAFRALLGRDGTREEIAVAPVVQKGGAKFLCQPASGASARWDCETPIRNWLYDTPAGRDACLLMQVRVQKEVYGIQKPTFKEPITGNEYHPCGPSPYAGGAAPPKFGYAELSGAYVSALYAAHTPAPTGGGGAEKKSPGEHVKDVLLAQQKKEMEKLGSMLKDSERTLDAVIRRAFQAAAGRAATDADVNALVPIFVKERAAYVRMVEVIRALDGLKNIKP